MVWSQQQIKCLESDFPVKTDKEVAQMIGKSPNALRIKAFCFPFEEQLLIKEWFNEKHSINPNIYSVKHPDKYPGKIWYFLSFRVKDSEKLIELFQKFEIPDCMSYKLGQNSYSTTFSEVREPSHQLVKGAEKTTERKEK